MNKVLTLVAAIVAALGVVALAGASGKPVHQACFGVQWYGASGAGSVSHGDVNVKARRHKVCVVGRRGKRGPRGHAGPAGPQGAVGCVVRKHGVLYKQGIVFCPAGPPGPAGPAGPAGAIGARGDIGPVGPQGPAGQDGLGNGIGYLCVSAGNNVKWGGTDGSLCDPGHDTLVKVVTETTP